MAILYWIFLLLKRLTTEMLWRHGKKGRYSRRRAKETVLCFGSREKPLWVRQEIVRLKALMPEYGCRKIADVFNRKFGERKKMTVSKTYVNTVIRNSQYAIFSLRNEIKKKKPRSLPRNIIWGMDLTGKTDSTGGLQMIAGIIDHGTRACLCLEVVKEKSSLRLLGIIARCCRKYGFPKFLRTDNEAIFTSTLFRTGLLLLGIRHQRTEVACPWQNGRIERFFGTLKERLNLLEVDSGLALQHALKGYRFWYNFVRPHQNLDGKTPAEAWGIRRKAFLLGGKEYWFEAWDGLLKGFYFPLR